MSDVKNRAFLSDDSELYDQSCYVSWYVNDSEHFNESSIYISDGENKVQFIGDTAAQVRMLLRLHEQLGAFIAACVGGGRELEPKTKKSEE